jgi:DNA-binding NtrC family response regulator
MARRFESEATVPLTARLSIQGGRIETLDGKATLQVGVERQLIGRANKCALVLDDGTVSAVHTEVQATPIGVHLVDMGSRNGVRLEERDGPRLVEGYLVGPCVFWCGACGLRFVPAPVQEIVVESAKEFGGLTGSTPEMLSLFSTLERYAASPLPIVITGETGTGKERVARAIHNASPRRERSFVAINCAALPDALLEAELFGHVKGAFTGADRDRNGLFVEANGGTLFFDEVAEMSPSLQAKVLRALEYGEVKPVGGERARLVDVRTLFATHEDLAEAVNRGRFREDLYFRIAVVSVKIPALRRRLEDLPLLVDQILADLGRPEVKVDDETIARLRLRNWPGNVRELRTVVQVALVGMKSNVLSVPDSLPSLIRARERSEPEALTYDEAEKEFKRRYLMGLASSVSGQHLANGETIGHRPDDRPQMAEAVRTRRRRRVSGARKWMS